MRKFKEDINETDEWQQYRDGISYKNNIGLYSAVNENYRYVQGSQWGNTKSEGLPMPVFNIILPILNYKLSQIFDKSAKIIFKCQNRESSNYVYLSEVAQKLSDYAENLWEILKMDKNLEDLVFDASVTGNGVAYFYYNQNKNEVEYEQVDITNIYPSDPNNPKIEKQKYIIIAYRRPTADVKSEAYAWKKEGKNKLSDFEIESISYDSDNEYQAGEDSRKELDGSSKTTVLMKMWKENGTVHFNNSILILSLFVNLDFGLPAMDSYSDTMSLSVVSSSSKNSRVLSRTSASRLVISPF